jgi:hypothetical protein
VKYSEFKRRVKVTLAEMNRYSDNAVELLCMIAAHESMCGTYRKQINGPALGLLQIEPFTHDSIWDNSDSIGSLADKMNIIRNTNSLVDDDRYTIFVGRCYLLMDANPLPKTVCEMGEYAKSYWNRTGKATPEQYVNDYIKWRERG